MTIVLFINFVLGALFGVIMANWGLKKRIEELEDEVLRARRDTAHTITWVHDLRQEIWNAQNHLHGLEKHRAGMIQKPKVMEHEGFDPYINIRVE